MKNPLRQLPFNGPDLLRASRSLAAAVLLVLGLGLPVQAQQAPQTAAWTSATPQDTTVVVSTLGYGLATISFNPSGSFTGGTFQFEIATDSGCTDWYSTYVVSSIGTESISSFVLTSTKTLWTVAVPATNCLRVRINPAISGSGTANLRLNVLPYAGPPQHQPAVAGNQTFNLNQVASNNVVTAGVNGLMAVGGNGGDNTALTANPIAMAGLARATGALPAQATANNQRVPITDLVGSLFVRPGSPFLWTCDLAGVAAASTRCLVAPGANIIAYITDILVDTTTATAGTWKLQTNASGGNCAAPSAFWPTNFTPTAPVLGSPQAIPLQTPLVPPANTEICVFGTATNTINIRLGGFYGP